MDEFALHLPRGDVLWSHLALTRSQLADLCGVTPQQIRYWTSRGFLPTAPGRPRRYNGEAIVRCLLIKQALDHGYPLRTAVVLARRFLAARPPGGAERLVRRP